MHVPALGLRRRRHIVIGDGHDRNVVEQGQHHDHDRGERLEFEEHDRRHHQQHDVERHRDPVIDVALDALENLPRADDGVDDGRKARRGQDQGRGTARGIGRPAHRDAAIGLPKGRRVVHPVAGHRDDMAALLQGLDDFVFVLRKHPAEAVGALDRGRRSPARSLVVAVLEHVACDHKLVAHAELLGDLVADRDIVAGHHLDVEAELLGLRDRGLGIRPRRVLHRDQPHQLPGLAVARIARRRARDSRARPGRRPPWYSARRSRHRPWPAPRSPAAHPWRNGGSRPSHRSRSLRCAC